MTLYTAGILAADYIFGLEPKQVYLRDINQDGITDVIVRTRKKKDHLFIAQPDGSYKRLEEITSEKNDSFIAAAQKKRKDLENLEKALEGQKMFFQSQQDSLYAKAKEIR